MAQANTVAIPVEHLRHIHEIQTTHKSEGESDTDAISFLDLVAAVAEFSDSEQEVVATVMHMLRSGRVQLSGSFSEPAATKLCG
jgi:hypothetical protein